MSKSLETYKLQILSFLTVFLLAIFAIPTNLSELSQLSRQIRVPGDAATFEDAMVIAKPKDLIIIDNASSEKFPIELTVPDITVMCNRDLVLYPPDNEFTFSIAADNVNLYFCPIGNPNAYLVAIQSEVNNAGNIMFLPHGRVYNSIQNSESPPNESGIRLRGRQ